MENEKKDELKIMLNYVYLIREREFVRLNETTYKIGKTQNEPNTRLSGYPKKSEVYLFVSVENCNEIEIKIINTFKNLFVHKQEYGNEYFNGDVDLMINTIISIRNNSKCINYNFYKNYLDSPKLPINIIEDDCKKKIISKLKIELEKNKYIYNIDKVLNVKYNCKLCNYCTNNRNCWYNHKNTARHKNLKLISSQKNEFDNVHENYNKNSDKNLEIELLKQKLELIEREKNLITKQYEKQLKSTKKQLGETKEQDEKQIEQAKEQFENHIDTLKIQLDLVDI